MSSRKKASIRIFKNLSLCVMQRTIQETFGGYFLFYFLFYFVVPIFVSLILFCPDQSHLPPDFQSLSGLPPSLLLTCAQYWLITLVYLSPCLPPTHCWVTCSPATSHASSAIPPSSFQFVQFVDLFQTFILIKPLFLLHFIPCPHLGLYFADSNHFWTCFAMRLPRYGWTFQSFQQKSLFSGQPFKNQPINTQKSQLSNTHKICFQYTADILFFFFLLGMNEEVNSFITISVPMKVCPVTSIDPFVASSMQRALA